MRTDDLVEAAAAIGDRLAATALRHRGAANWLCRDLPPVATPGAPLPDPVPVLAALNPSVYSGTAGVGVFLARLSAVTDDRRHRRIAVEAVRHAVAHAWDANDGPVGRLGTEWRHGFYLGSLGIAWAALEVSRGTHEEGLGRAARRILHRLTSERRPAAPHDLLYGSAGAIPALLDLARRGEADGARDLALRLGRTLLASHRRQARGGWSWGRDRRNLTGLSHGTAGVAYALALLSRETGEDTWAEGARRAIAYERSVFDRKEGNWPDFKARPDPRGRYPFATAWCHGAPGIGVSRLAAAPALKDPRLKAEARIALQTTRKRVERDLGTPGLDAALCHGAVGNAECLWLLEEGLGVDGARARAARSARLLLARHGEEARETWGSWMEWPTGVPAGPYPPLITGLAGIAYFFLRIHDPKRFPTVLLPGLAMLR